jgi:hypothetical protein
MGPAAENSTLSLSIKVLNLPKLKDNLLNWITYKECIFNTLVHKGLWWHALGSARKPIEAELHADGKHYLPGIKDTLTEDELEKMEEKADAYLQKKHLSGKSSTKW